MHPYYNLPPEQRFTQRLVDQFNADERLWKKLAPQRRARRKLLRRFLSKKAVETARSGRICPRTASAGVCRAVGQSFMHKTSNQEMVPVQRIEHAILLIRGQRVILDRELAALYGVTTGNLNKAVRRNIDRFRQISCSSLL